MILFGKTVEVYSSNNEKDFGTVKRLLKQNGVKYNTSWTQNEIVGGCGCKINIKKVANPNYSPYVWYVFVKQEDEVRARELIENRQA